MAPEWWATFFDGAWADVDTSVIAPGRTKEDVEAAEHLLEPGPGTRVLHVAVCLLRFRLRRAAFVAVGRFVGLERPFQGLGARRLLAVARLEDAA